MHRLRMYGFSTKRVDCLTRVRISLRRNRVKRAEWLQSTMYARRVLQRTDNTHTHRRDLVIKSYTRPPPLISARVELT